MRALGLLTRLLLLAALAFLGFYVYGLVLGVFSPGEMIGFTIIAVVCVVAGVVHAVRIRRAMSGPDRARITHDLQKHRETRGW
jgi:hypothetical protein